MWEDVEGQESFPASARFELTTQGLSVQEHNYSAIPPHTQNGNANCLAIINTVTQPDIVRVPVH